MTEHLDPALRRTRFTTDLEATAYYVVSESLANVAKHARATNVRVTLDQEAAALRLVVADDGRGFDPTSVAGRGGLSNIGDRVSAAGGRLTVASTGQGTTVTIDLPIVPEPGAEGRPEKPTEVGAGYG